MSGLDRWRERLTRADAGGFKVMVVPVAEVAVLVALAAQAQAPEPQGGGLTDDAQPRSVSAGRHGVALDKGSGIVCLCGQVCNAVMRKSPAPLFGERSDGMYEAVNAGTVFARHLKEARAQKDTALAARAVPAEILADMDRIADQRDEAQLETMRAKASEGEWVAAYHRELVARKTLADRVRALADEYHDEWRAITNVGDWDYARRTTWREAERRTRALLDPAEQPATRAPRGFDLLRTCSEESDLTPITGGLDESVEVAEQPATREDGEA